MNGFIRVHLVNGGSIESRSGIDMDHDYAAAHRLLVSMRADGTPYDGRPVRQEGPPPAIEFEREGHPQNRATVPREAILWVERVVDESDGAPSAGKGSRLRVTPGRGL